MATAKTDLEAPRKIVSRRNDFVDEVMKAGGVNINKCLQCGRCTASCPSGKHTAYRTRMIIRRAMAGFREEVLGGDDIWLCTTCYTCYERCPRGIDVVNVIQTLRNMSMRVGGMLSAHRAVALNLYKTGHAVPIDPDTKEKRLKLGLPEIPPTVHSSSIALSEVHELLEQAGFLDVLETALTKQIRVRPPEEGLFL